MNRKGFTLVELLAVIVILVGISLTAVMGISASLEKRDSKEYDEQIQIAISAAKIYFSLNEEKSVTIKTLKNEDYFSSDRKIDRLSICDIIKISAENSYEFIKAENCEEE